MTNYSMKLIKRALKGIDVACLMFDEIKSGMKCQFTDCKTDRVYEITIKELYNKEV